MSPILYRLLKRKNISLIDLKNVQLKKKRMLFKNIGMEKEITLFLSGSIFADHHLK